MKNDQHEIDIVLQSLRDLEEDLLLKAESNGKNSTNGRQTTASPSPAT